MARIIASLLSSDRGMVGVDPAMRSLDVSSFGENGHARDWEQHERTGSQRAENSQSLVPEPQEQQQGERPLRHAEHPARSPDAEHRVHPEEQRAVADIGNQHLRLVVEPLLIPEEQEENDQRGPHQVVVEIFSQQAEPDRGVDQHVHSRAPSFCGLYDAAPRAPVPASATTGPHTELRANTATITRPIAAPVSPSSIRSIPLVSPGTYN